MCNRLWSTFYALYQSLKQQQVVQQEEENEEKGNMFFALRDRALP